MTKRIVVSIVFLLFLTSPLFADYAHWEATATSTSGNPLKGYNVKVLEYPGGTPAEVYSDDQGVVKSQPFQTSSNDGTYDFWTNADGGYKVIVYGAFGTYQTVYLSVSGTSITSSDIYTSTVGLVHSTSSGSQTIEITGDDEGLYLLANGNNSIVNIQDSLELTTDQIRLKQDFYKYVYDEDEEEFIWQVWNPLDDLDLSSYIGPVSFTDGPVSLLVSNANLNKLDLSLSSSTYIRANASNFTSYIEGDFGGYSFFATDSTGEATSIVILAGVEGDDSGKISFTANQDIIFQIEKDRLTNWAGGNAQTHYGKRLNYGGILTPVEGDTFFDLTLHIPCFYNGTAWKSTIDGTTGCTDTE